MAILSATLCYFHWNYKFIIYFCYRPVHAGTDGENVDHIVYQNQQQPGIDYSIPINRIPKTSPAPAQPAWTTLRQVGDDL